MSEQSNGRQIIFGAILTGAGGPGHANAWRDPQVQADSSIDVGWYIEQARLAEQAKLDLVFIVDSQFITPDSPPHYLNRLEPFTVLSALAVTTTHIGLVGTVTTSYNDPFNTARRFASLDLISGGRAGWNVVTSGDAGTASNFSLDEHFDYDTRYGRALEHVEVVKALWDSYEDDAFPRDRESGVFLDPSKLHALHHRGEHFQVAGPLNISRSPQGQPVIFQAGDSEQGRDLGARIGEGIFTFAPTLEAGKAFAADLKARAAALGREPSGVLILPGTTIFVGDTDDQAREIERATQLADGGFEKALGEFGRSFGWHDFRQYDLDAPFPAGVLRFAERSFRTQAEKIVAFAEADGLTLRQVVEAVASPKPGPFTGTAETVADALQQWFEAGAVDGFNLHVGRPDQFRRFVNEVLPILRARGLFREEYSGTTLRENLGLPFVENRHTVARRRAEESERAELDAEHGLVANA
ncbi:LLM class flavin-dependent oxidoreductase [Herbiconiux sp. KACC 21604]|uniref:LLM class flavin-dependent oxidoreductase n=1 Tax=unclassified Herbiconiux TaxID=2618217 RepID=UPI00149093D2|nr:LLM class flavin-dependent oxidoreductase [Herbiconiux sp. SALV-R1]QJU53899.1 LLM class flavin-dependent oxidoreductase [Herbiconiux sp. SALV-R1]WPO84917.1 LLM class flavin-dependent oxidoreductase [Herbiconiux sp. KACC 21604]